MYLMAQGIDALAGNSGWAGAGLLGLVLAWLLLVHLPSRDKRDDQTQARFTDALEKIGHKYESSLQRITEHCEKENDDISGDVRQLTLAMQDLAEMVSRAQAHDAKRTMRAEAE